jgi:hypothetical protein
MTEPRCKIVWTSDVEFTEVVAPLQGDRRN